MSDKKYLSQHITTSDQSVAQVLRRGRLTLTSTVLLLFQNCMFHSNISSDLKAFADKFGFDVLILLASYLSEEEQPRRQIAVYSQNLELCSQVRTSFTPTHLLPNLLAVTTCGRTGEPMSGSRKCTTDERLKEMHQRDKVLKKCWGYVAHWAIYVCRYICMHFYFRFFRVVVFSFEAMSSKNHLIRIGGEINIGPF